MIHLAQGRKDVSSTAFIHRGIVMKKRMSRLTIQGLILLSMLFGCQEQSESDVESNDGPGEVETPSDALPSRFTDRLIFPVLAASDDPSDREEAVHAFEMIAVPGDPDHDMKPFYLSRTEVRLEMFYPWAMGYGMGWNDGEVNRRLGFYPSQYAMVINSRSGLFNKHFPALAMSRTVAEQYCKTLSEQSGRTYRLPTEKEWEHALKLGGGMPKNRDALLQMAHLETDESWSDEPPFLPVPIPVGTKSADRLGLHDLLGNAAEWVTDTGMERAVRGGHFDLPAEDFDFAWRAVEDLEVWNETYPQLPVSRTLYRDFPYTGIRLACDADQAPITTPDVAQTPESPAP